MEAEILEPDLQMTRDGHLVAFHDPTLDRTARGPEGICGGRVSERTLEELRTCDVGRWFNERFPGRARPEFEGQGIVTLDELFTRWGARVRWYPETKAPEEAPGMEEALVKLIRRHGLRDAAAERGQVLIQSFSRSSLETIRRLDPGLPRVQLLAPEALDGREALDGQAAHEFLAQVAAYAHGVGPHHGLVNGSFMQAARDHGLFVHPWTVNEPEEMGRLIDLGVDGIFTDFPDRLRKRLVAT